MATRALRIAIDARMASGISGGVESVIIGLVRGLSDLDDGPESYFVLSYRGEDEWIRPYAFGPTRLLTLDRPTPVRHRLSAAAPALASIWRRRPWRRNDPPRSDGTIEQARIDVIHFTTQAGFRTGVKSIYHPHDLQHVHLPELFTRQERTWRESSYRALCEQAAMVAVASRFTKADVEREYGLEPAKVIVVPLAPPTTAYAASAHGDAVARRTLGVPESYLLYPAQTWPHKNHIALLRALALLRRRGIEVPLVASGRQTDHFSALMSEQDRLGVGDLMTWLGFVAPKDLVALYRGASAVVIPSRFEAASAPMWEAFEAGVPVAASAVTSLPDQAAGAAVLFDPDDVSAIALAIERLWTDAGLRHELVDRGTARVRELSWDRTARTFRAHYRRLAGRHLDEHDRELISAPAPF